MPLKCWQDFSNAQSLLMPIQDTTKQSETTDSSELGLPERLFLVMSSNNQVSNSLLQDPNIQQWFQQTQMLINALAGNESSPSLSISTKGLSSVSAASGNMNLQAQNTLLSLTSLLKEQPNNVILQHLVQDLQKVIEPALPMILSSIPQLNATPLQNVQASKGLNADSENTSRVGTEPIVLNSVESHSSHKHASIKKQNMAEANVNKIEFVTPAKSKLELLIAKHAIHVPVATDPVPLDTLDDSNPEIGLDSSMLSTNPTLQLTDLLKTPLHSLNTIEAAPQTISAANFAQEMTENILKNMKVTLSEGISEAKLSLFPKNLGHVDVKITMHEGQLIAHFAADSLAGKQMLESQLPQLRQSLQSQGLQVEKLEVTQNSSMQSSMFQDQRNQQPIQQSFRQNKNRSGKYDQDS